MENKKPVAVVVCAGPGNGAALARRFDKAGYATAILSRHRSTLAPIESELTDNRGFECDVSDPTSVENAFTSIWSELGEVNALLYNAGSGVFGDIETITAGPVRAGLARQRLRLCARQVIPGMKARGAGAIIFIGATASRRGGVQTVAFAPAKAAQRSLAELMARKLWPEGVHVALIVIDGVVDLPSTRAAMPDKPDDAFVEPAGVAEIAYQLCRQYRRAWSFEVEARPYAEKW